MKIVIAPDSYKGALSAREAADAMAVGVQRAMPEADILTCPMGDGGEGTLSALLAATDAELRHAEVLDAYARPVRAAWGWHAASGTAFVELAEACGLPSVDLSRHALRDSTTYGVGQLVVEALDAGARSLVLTLGGSATNDAGAGLLMALGGRLLNVEGEALPLGAGRLAHLDRVDLSGLDPRLKDLSVMAAVDVDNPLLGDYGATVVYGPQKGASTEDVEALEAALQVFAERVSQATGQDVREAPGAGAAGGMGYAAMAFLGATLKPGIQVVIEQAALADKLEGADLVITGEGRLDGQSLSGKTPIGVARLAKSQGVPAIVLAGQLAGGWREAYEQGVTAAFSLTDGPMPLATAIRQTPSLLSDRCEAVVRLLAV
ncbi:glycerate kinase [Halomonas smyrnensis]|uniref:glycerate kinase n=1 Tax=Halomonas smyrnensis TaxID=720605 RepID=UPI0002E10618|nr:glycerate kinase [Halomonas smyrnensis]